MFSIVLYTYDIGLQGKQSDNFYFQLNDILRRRVVCSFLFMIHKQISIHFNTQFQEIEAIKGFLFFAISGLRKLPSITGVVFRGNNSPDVIAKEYTLGREIFWSGFTSTTTELSSALQFAGQDGVVFRMHINSGKSISNFSCLPNEKEVLLPPNACLIVTQVMHIEADGVKYVDLLEKAGTFKW